MDRRRIESRAKGVAELAAGPLGLQVIDAEFVRDSGYWYLRVYIEKPGGIAIDDCANLSTAIGAELDRQDFVPASYILEVSSSGEKPLRRDEEYDEFKGRWALVNTYSEINGRKRFEGLLMGNAGDSVLMEVDGTAVEIPRQRISAARLAVPFKEVRGDESE